MFIVCTHWVSLSLDCSPLILSAVFAKHYSDKKALYIYIYIYTLTNIYSDRGVSSHAFMCLSVCSGIHRLMNVAILPSHSFSYFLCLYLFVCLIY